MPKVGFLRVASAKRTGEKTLLERRYSARSPQHDAIIAGWQENLKAFKVLREPYLLYPKKSAK